MVPGVRPSNKITVGLSSLPTVPRMKIHIFLKEQIMGKNRRGNGTKMGHEKGQ